MRLPTAASPPAPLPPHNPIDSLDVVAASGPRHLVGHTAARPRSLATLLPRASETEGPRGVAWGRPRSVRVL